jgi:hypothetical protein
MSLNERRKKSFIASYIQYLLDLTGPHLADLEFNVPNFGSGLFRKYQTSPAETQKSGKHSPIVRKNWIKAIISPWGNN